MPTLLNWLGPRIWPPNSQDYRYSKRRTVWQVPWQGLWSRSCLCLPGLGVHHRVKGPW
eukprot:27341_1